MKLESIADAISRYNAYAEPESESYTLRNPGMLPASDRKEQAKNECGIRVFSCHRAGYQALLDVLTKRSENFPAEPLSQTLKAFGITYAKQKEEACDFIGRALNTLEISQNTNLSYFAEK